MISSKKLQSIFISFSLVCLSTAISLLLAEVAVRVVSPQNLNGSLFMETGKGLLVNRSSGTAMHQLGERIVKYTFHEFHLRGTPIREEGIKVLVLGDSFTFGWLVDKNDTYVRLLQKYADNEYGVGKFQFLNGAASGWGAADYVAYIEDFGRIINPDIVLVFINTDDIGRSISKNIYSVSGGDSLTLNRNIIKPSLIKKIINSIPGYEWFLENSHLLQITRKAVLGQGRRHNDENKNDNSATPIIDGPDSKDLNASRQSAITLGKALFRHLNEWCKANSKYLIVTTTGWHKLEDANTSSEPTNAFMSVSDEFFKSINIPFLDISPYVSQIRAINPGKYIISVDCHPNENGHKLIAETSWRQFINSQISEYCRTSLSKTEIVNF